MRVSVGCDHAGFELKLKAINLLHSFGHTTFDVGAFHSKTACDYPDFARPVVLDIQGGKSDFGVLICGSGIGMSIVANRYKGIRAVLCHNKLCAQLAREHNDANILCLGARLVNEAATSEILQAFFESKPSNEARHITRINKIDQEEFDVF